MSNSIKDKIEKKNMIYKKFIRNGNALEDFERLQIIQKDIDDTINANKKAHYDRLSSKLSDPKTSSKAYWSIIKSFFTDTKVPVIPPLFLNNKFVSDFSEKAEVFNLFFTKQCSPIVNSSELPDDSMPMIANSISSIQFLERDLLNLVRLLDPSKSHGFDGISIRMIKICDASIIKPLLIIFKNSLNTGIFPHHWKMANVTPIHKKGEKTEVSNYRPISVLPVCGKLFEKLIYNALYNFFDRNNVLTSNQSGFRAGDSCTNQLISITHTIFESFDVNPPKEVRGVFLDISKAFDRVWHDGLLYKLKINGVNGQLLSLLKSFLNDRHQRVVLNGQCSKWSSISAGVPQGSILGPLLFLIYINDISLNINSIVKLFADDTSIFSIVDDPNISASNLNDDLEKINQWSYQWKMEFNPGISKQAKEVIFSTKNKKVPHPDLTFNNINVTKTTVHKHLGLLLDEKLSFKDHINEIFRKAAKGINIIRKLRYFLPRTSLLTIYKSFIRSHLDYVDVIYDQPNNSSLVKRIESIQYNAALAITGAIRGSSTEKLYHELGLEYLSSRRWLRRLSLFFKIIKNKSPNYLYELIPKPNHSLNLRNQNKCPQIFCRTNIFSNSFFPNVIREWNNLSDEISSSVNLSTFRSLLLQRIRKPANSIFGISNPPGIQHLTRLRLGLSHLKHHKFNHNFIDTLDPQCPCGFETESVSHFFLRCQLFQAERLILMNEILNIDPDIHLLDDISISNLLLYGDKKYDFHTNSKILSCSINFILSSKRFDGPLY